MEEDIGKGNARHRWTKEEEHEICQLFQKNIQDKNICVEEARNKIANNALLKDISRSKVRDKVRSLFVKFIDDDAVQLPNEEETASERITCLDKYEALVPSLSLFTNTCKGGAFSEDQMHTLVTLFEDLIITTTRIESNELQ